MTDSVRITNYLSIPMTEIVMSAVRAQGPGGQGVNKTSSAVHLRFDYQNSAALNPVQKARIAKFRDSRVTASGLIIIKAQSHRVQERNRADALTRLQELIAKAIYIAPKRRPTRPSLGAKRRRLKKKTERGQTKALRGRVRRDTE